MEEGTKLLREVGILVNYLYKTRRPTSCICCLEEPSFVKRAKDVQVKGDNSDIERLHRLILMVGNSDP